MGRGWTPAKLSGKWITPRCSLKEILENLLEIDRGGILLVECRKSMGRECGMMRRGGGWGVERK